MSPHRNDPCPCGSGKKYKRCCGASPAEGEELSAAARNSALEALIRFGARDEFTDSMSAGVELCLGEAYDPEDEELPLHEHPISANLMAFLHFDHEIEEGRSLIDVFLERRASSSITAGARRYLEQLRDSYFGVYEVLEINPGEGGRLRDLWQGGELAFEDPSTDETMKPWDVVVTRVVPQTSGVHRLESDMLAFPPGSKAALLAQLEADHRAMVATRPGLAPARFLASCGHRLIAAWLQSMEAEAGFVDAEGEPIEPTTSIFSVVARDKVVGALDRLYEEDEEEEDTWIIADEDEDEGLVLHHVGGAWIEEDVLFVQTMTRSRAEVERDMIESLCRGALRHQETRTVSFERYLEENPEEEYPDDEDPHELSGEALEIVLRRRERHYRRWIDDEIPALLDRSPREIVRDRELAHLVPALIELLKQVENREARSPSVPGHPYDFGWMWKELGLERPTGGTPNPTPSSG